LMMYSTTSREELFRALLNPSRSLESYISFPQLVEIQIERKKM